jgi:NADPH:quinone reductase-like Zn-dependent oxidoreductase
LRKYQLSNHEVNKYRYPTELLQEVDSQKSERIIMKAVVYDRYGSADVLRLEAPPKPTPGTGEVLVRVMAASVNAGDWHLMQGKPRAVRLVYGLRKPKHPVLGSDIAGYIEAVGDGVTAVAVGDAVFADLSDSGLGGFAEYALVPATKVVPKPDTLSFEEAAAIPVAAITALQGLRKGQLQAGQQVLIHGASGGVGTYAVQLAKALGAQVTAVCSTSKVEQARTLGADTIIDYTKHDFSRQGKQYDLILAANGDRSIFDYRRALKPRGRYVNTGGEGRQLSQALLLGPLLSLGPKKMGNLLARSNSQDLSFIKTLIDKGKVKPVIDRCYPLAQVAEAMRYMEAGHAKGKIIIRVAHKQLLKA